MKSARNESYLQTALSSERTVLHPIHVDLCVVNFAKAPTLEVTTERVRVCSPSGPRQSAARTNHKRK